MSTKPEDYRFDIKDMARKLEGLTIRAPEICPTCEGSGTFQEEHPYGMGTACETLTCYACEGTGVMNSTRMKTCGECSGRGTQRVNHTHTDGKVYLENVMCLQCRGEGQVRDSQFSIEESKRYYQPPKQTDGAWYESNILPWARRFGYECPCCSIRMHYSDLHLSKINADYDVVGSCGCITPVHFKLSHVLMATRDSNTIAKVITEKLAAQREAEYALLVNDTSKMDNATYVRHMQRKRKA